MSTRVALGRGPAGEVTTSLAVRAMGGSVAIPDLFYQLFISTEWCSIDQCGWHLTTATESVGSSIEVPSGPTETGADASTTSTAPTDAARPVIGRRTVASPRL